MNVKLSKPYLNLENATHTNTWLTACSTLFMMLLISACSENETIKRSPLKGLGDPAGAFKKPSRDNKIEFPAAHAPQKAYQQEWWYLTANLTTESGEALATQWTLFRRGVENKHWYFAHAALANAEQHHSAFRSAREALGNLTISNKVTNSEAFNAKIDDWQWQSRQSLLPATLRYGNVVGSALKENSAVNKQVVKQKPYWQVKLNLSLSDMITAENNNASVTGQTLNYFLQGENGFSQKHATLDIASHYYSQPFIKVSGEVYWQDKWQKVTGNAWFDREWGSQMLAEDQQGWDWFSLRLNDDTALMVYRIRSTEKDYLYGSLMKQDGSIRTLSSEDIALKSHFSQQLVTNPSYPDSFSIEIAQEEIDITVKVINKNQIMRFGIEYFEGMVSFSGSHQGQGFLEMTGYDD
jgi:predicted secreted hydrolase